MSHSYAQNHLHVVFSTKEREKLIAKPMQTKLWSYMAGIARNHDFFVIAHRGMEDQVYFLILLPPILPFAENVYFFKNKSFQLISGNRNQGSCEGGKSALACHQIKVC